MKRFQDHKVEIRKPKSSKGASRNKPHCICNYLREGYDRKDESAPMPLT